MIVLTEWQLIGMAALAFLVGLVVGLSWELP